VIKATQKPVLMIKEAERLYSIEEMRIMMIPQSAEIAGRLAQARINLFAPIQEGKSKWKNMNSADRGKENRRAEQKERAEKDWKELKAEIRELKTDFDREQVDQWVLERDYLAMRLDDFETYGNNADAKQVEIYNELDKQYRKLSWNLFKMYDMYQRTENVSKVTIDQAIENPAKPALLLNKASDEVPKAKIFLPKEIPRPSVWTERDPWEYLDLSIDGSSTSSEDDKGKGIAGEEKSPVPDQLFVDAVNHFVGKPTSESKPLEEKKRRVRKRGPRRKRTTGAKTLEAEKPKQADKPKPAEKKSFKDALKTNTVERPVREAIKPNVSDIKKKAPVACRCCNKQDHRTHECKNLPKGFVIKTQKEMEKMTQAQKKAMFLKNTDLLKHKPYQKQSASLHEPVKGSLSLHDCLIPIFNPRAGNTGVDKEFWGTMEKVHVGGVWYVIATEHQVLDYVYYNGNDNQVHLLPPRDKWSTYGDGNISFCRIPADNLKGLAKIKAVSVETPQKGHGHACLYIGLNPKTMEREVIGTTYSWDGDKTHDVIHSATTANFSCGSFLYDSKLKAVVALHHGSLGPDSKHGENNLCSPLKAMGLRQ